MHRCTFRKSSRGLDMAGRCLTTLGQWICEFIFLFCCGIELIFVKSNSILNHKITTQGQNRYCHVHMDFKRSLIEPGSLSFLYLWL